MDRLAVPALALLALRVCAVWAAALCPPLQPGAAELDCSPARCGDPLPAGSTTRSSCRAFYRSAQGGPAQRTATCLEGGVWSAPPLSCVPECGQPTGKGVPLIKGGQTAKSVDFPWHVVLYSSTENGLQPMCGGSLVTPKYFISAAHCFWDKKKMTAASPADFRIAVGNKTRRDWDAEGETAVQRRTIHIPSNYLHNINNYFGDLALVELSEEVALDAYTLPICVDWTGSESGLQEGDNGLVAGYGATDKERVSPDLQYTWQPYIPYTKCIEAVPSGLRPHIKVDKYCAGNIGGSTVTNGDSGGGLAFQRGKSWFLRGVVSLGLPDRQTYSVFTNVSYYISWANSIIEDDVIADSSCGVASRAAKRARGGDPASGDDFPWTVGLYNRSSSASPGARELRCLGTLIKPTLVITSAFCVADGYSGPLSPQLFLAGVGKLENPSGKKMVWRDVAGIYVPPEFLGIFLFNMDIGIVELGAALDVMPACVDWLRTDLAPLANGQAGMMVNSAPGAQSNPSLQWTRLPFMDITTCRKYDNYKEWKHLTADKICVGLVNGSATFSADRVSRFGQRPVPLMIAGGFMMKTRNRWYLRGVPSYAFSSDKGGVGIAVTSMEANAVYDFVSDNVLSLRKCGVGSNTVASKFDGEQAGAGDDFPWNVAFYYNSSIKCVGTLVTPEYVLTAATCFQNRSKPLPLSEFRAAAGKFFNGMKRKENGTVYWSDVSSIRLAWREVEGYTSAWDIDIAIVKLASPMNVMPACVDWLWLGGKLGPLAEGEVGRIVSWPSGNERDNDTLHVTHAPYISRSVCLQILRDNFCPWSHLQSIKGSMFCSGPHLAYLLEYHVVQPGSSFMTKRGDEWYLRGIRTSHIRRNDILGYVSLDYRPVRKWLASAGISLVS